MKSERGQEQKDRRARRKAAMAAFAAASARRLAGACRRGGSGAGGRAAARPRNRAGDRTRPHRRRRRCLQHRRSDGDARNGPAAFGADRPRLCARPRQGEGAARRHPRRKLVRRRNPRGGRGKGRRAAAREGRPRPTRSGAPRRPRRRSIFSPWCGERTDGHAEQIAAQITGGFADPVFDAQAVFRAVMDAMARPGTMQPVGGACRSPPQPLSADGRRRRADALRPRHAALARPGACAARPTRSNWLGFHTGAPLAHTPADAHFALVADPASLIAFENFAQGTQEYPDRSTTLILQVASLSSGDKLLLKGPASTEAATIAPAAAAAPFRRAVEAEPRALSARRRPHSRRARGHRLPAAHDAHSSSGGLSRCMLPSRAAKPPSAMPTGCWPTAGAATATCRRCGSTRSSSSLASASTG